MDKEQHRAAKARLVAQMQAGRSWQAAAATAGMQISQSTAYRLLQVVRIRGEAALQDGRHGHPSKLHGEARTFLVGQLPFATGMCDAEQKCVEGAEPCPVQHLSRCEH